MSETCSTADMEKHNEYKYLSDDVASREYLKKWRRELDYFVLILIAVTNVNHTVATRVISITLI